MFQRSTPQARAAEKWAWRWWAGAATRAATAATSAIRMTTEARFITPYGMRSWMRSLARVL